MTVLPDRAKYVNPLLLNDTARAVVESAARLLAYERYHDGLEREKMRDHELPTAVEQSVARSIHTTVLDAHAFSRLSGGLMAELDTVGLLDAVVPTLAHITPASLPELLDSHAAAIERQLAQRGMDRHLWQWAVRSVPWDDLLATVEDGTLVTYREGRRVGAIAARRPPAPDAAAFVADTVGLPRPLPAPAEADNGTVVGACDLVDAATRQVRAFHERRAVRTAADGVQVLPTGIPVIVVFLIIAAVILIVGLVLASLCGVGVITDRGTCAVAPFFILVGFLALLALVGTGNAADMAGAETDTDPDPPG
ncbi:MAG: hypothetical protein ACM30G_00685 [Micromonosporaceae bacterium]